MEQKKTISELYQECKEKAEQKLEPTVEVQKGYLFDALVASVKLSPIPIPPIPQSFQGKV